MINMDEKYDLNNISVELFGEKYIKLKKGKKRKVLDEQHIRYNY